MIGIAYLFGFQILQLSTQIFPEKPKELFSFSGREEAVFERDVVCTCASDESHEVESREEFGEKLNQLENFHIPTLASRISWMRVTQRLSWRQLGRKDMDANCVEEIKLAVWQNKF